LFDFPFPSLGVRSVVVSLCILFPLVTYWARIYLGAHYMSDCMVGTVYALVVCLLGWGFNVVFGHIDTAYSFPGCPHSPLLNTVRGIACVSIVALLLYGCLAQPVRFWIKAPLFFSVIVPPIMYYAVFAPNESPLLPPP
ncbi:hypothetical protein KIPB_013692, partial [Kipferlia bialata]